MGVTHTDRQREKYTHTLHVRFAHTESYLQRLMQRDRVRGT